MEVAAVRAVEAVGMVDDGVKRRRGCEDAGRIAELVEKVKNVIL